MHACFPAVLQEYVVPAITFESVWSCLTENLKAYFPCKLCHQAKWMPIHKFIVKNLDKLHCDHYSDEAVYTLDIHPVVSSMWKLSKSGEEVR